jgi:hypothetical protein
MREVSVLFLNTPLFRTLHVFYCPGTDQILFFWVFDEEFIIQAWLIKLWPIGNQYNLWVLSLLYMFEVG